MRSFGILGVLGTMVLTMNVKGDDSPIREAEEKLNTPVCRECLDDDQVPICEIDTTVARSAATTQASALKSAPTGVFRFTEREEDTLTERAELSSVALAAEVYCPFAKCNPVERTTKQVPDRAAPRLCLNTRDIRIADKSEDSTICKESASAGSAELSCDKSSRPDCKSSEVDH